MQIACDRRQRDVGDRSVQHRERQAQTDGQDSPVPGSALAGRRAARRSLRRASRRLDCRRFVVITRVRTSGGHRMRASSAASPSRPATSKDRAAAARAHRRLAAHTRRDRNRAKTTPRTGIPRRPANASVPYRSRPRSVPRVPDRPDRRSWFVRSDPARPGMAPFARSAPRLREPTTTGVSPSRAQCISSQRLVTPRWPALRGPVWRAAGHQDHEIIRQPKAADAAAAPRQIGGWNDGDPGLAQLSDLPVIVVQPPAVRVAVRMRAAGRDARTIPVSPRGGTAGGSMTTCWRFAGHKRARSLAQSTCGAIGATPERSTSEASCRSGTSSNQGA